jgi:hypothetical protein
LEPETSGSVARVSLEQKIHYFQTWVKRRNDEQRKPQVLPEYENEHRRTKNCLKSVAALHDVTAMKSAGQ